MIGNRLFSLRNGILFLLAMVIMGGVLYAIIPSEQQRAEYFQESGNLEKAAEVYRQQLREEPENRELVEKLIHLYRQLDRVDAEQKMIGRHLDLEFDENLARRRAQILEEQGRNEEALEMYRYLSNHRPERMEYYRHRVRLHRWAGREKEALGVLREAREIYPGDPDLLQQLLEQNRAAGGPGRERIQVLESLIEQTDNPEPFRRDLAGSHLEQKNFRAAREQYQHLLQNAETKEERVELLEQLRNAYRWDESIKTEVAAEAFARDVNRYAEDQATIRHFIALQRKQGNRTGEEQMIKQYLDRTFDTNRAERRAHLLERAGRFREALKMYELLSHHHPRAYRYYRERARLHRWIEEPEQVESVYSEARQHLPRNSRVLNHLLAFHRSRSGNMKERIKLTRELIDVADPSLPYRIQLGDLYLESGRFEEARNQYRNVLEDVKPEQRPNLLRKRGLSNIWDDRVLEGTKHLESYLELRPEDRDIRNRIISIYREYDMLSRALPHLSYRARRGKVDDEMMNLLAESLLAAGHPDQALFMYTYLVHFVFPSRERVQTLARLHHSRQQVRRAAFYYHQLLRYPGNPPVQAVEFLEVYYERTGQLEKLQDMYRRIRDRMENRVYDRRYIDLFLARGRYEKGIQAAHDYLSEHPEDRMVLETLAELHRSNGEKQKYREVRVRLADLYPGDTDLVWESGYALWNAGEEERAIDVFEKARRHGNPTPDQLLQLAGLYAHIDQPGEAFDILVALHESDRLPYETLPDLAAYGNRADRREEAREILDERVPEEVPEEVTIEVLVHIAGARAIAGEEERARELHRYIMDQTSGDLNMLMEMGRNLMRAEMPLEARAYFRRVLTEEPENTDALRLAGQSAVWSGDPEGGLVHLQRYLENEPEDASIQYLVGETHYVLGQNRHGYYAHRRTVDLFQTNPPTSVGERLMYARAAARTGRTDRSLDLFESVIREVGVTREMGDSYIRTLLDLERYEKAEYELNTRFSRFRDETAYKRYLARIYSNTNRVRRAVSILEDLEETAEDQIGLWIDLSYLKPSLGTWKEALHYVHRALRERTIEAMSRTTIGQGRGTHGLFRQRSEIVRELDTRIQMEGTFQSQEDDDLYTGTLEYRSHFSKHVGFRLYQSTYHGEGVLPAPAEETESIDVQRTGMDLILSREDRWEARLGTAYLYPEGDRAMARAYLRRNMANIGLEVEMEARIRDLWQDPPRAVLLGGVRDEIGMTVSQELNDRLNLQVEGSAAHLSIDGRENLPGGSSPDGEEYSGTAELRFEAHHNPFLSFSLAHSHTRQYGDDALFSLLPLAERSSATRLSFYNEHNVTRHWTAIVNGGIGRDGARDVDLIYFSRIGFAFRPMDRLELRTGYEYSSEAIPSSTGSTGQFNLGMTLHF